MMKAQMIAAGFAMLALGAVAPAAMADGPRAASGNNWAGMSTPAAQPVAGAPAAAVEGPRASSGNNWPGMAAPEQIAAAPQNAAAVAPSAEPRRVWIEGYDKGGRWHGQWEFVR
jgi:hypothetical protein